MSGGAERKIDNEPLMEFTKSGYVIRGSVSRVEEYVEEGNSNQEGARYPKM